MRLGRNTKLKTYPSPVRGWNARESIASMKDDEAVFLDNWFPSTGDVQLRNGYESHATGMGGHVETLISYESSSQSQLISAANNNLWNATTAGAAVSIGSGYMNNRWYSTVMNSTLALMNGEDAPVKWDGTTLSTLTITGPTAINLIGAHAYKGRSYFWELDSSSFWYSAVNALGGVLTEYDLKTLATGKIMTIESWSRDAGDGMDDFMVIVMSTGDVLVYQGESPADTVWTVVGKYKTGDPIARNAVVKIGGDLVIMTVDGFLPMSAIMQKGEFAKNSAVNDRIRNAVKDAAINYKSNFGWDVVYHPEAGMGIFNIPVVENQEAHQYVVNTFTGAWCRFKGQQANAWALCNGSLYFGSSGGVIYKADTGSNDNGAEIEGDGMTSFSYMGNQLIKSFSGMQFVIASEGDINIETRIGVDFITPNINFISSTFPATGTDWDAGDWDSFFWAGPSEVKRIWKITSKVGYSAAARIRVKTGTQGVKWFSTSYIYKIGGAL